MSIYILDDKKLKNSSKKDIDAAIKLNRNRIKTCLIKDSGKLDVLVNDPYALLFIPNKITQQHNKILSFCNYHKIPVVCAHNHSNQNADYIYSTINGDSADYFRDLISYCNLYEKNRIAFFCHSPKNKMDLNKISSLANISQNFNESDVFFTCEGWDKAFERFYKTRNNYDAILCSSDYCAIVLTEYLKETDADYLNDCFIIGFGNTILSKLCFPTITSCSYDMDDEIDALSYIYRMFKKNKKSFSSINIVLKDYILVRESTQNLPFVEKDVKKGGVFYPLLNRHLYFSDINENIACERPSSSYQTIMMIEQMMESFKMIDFQIICFFLKGIDSNKICESLFISTSSLHYHSQKMFKALKVDNKNDFVKKILPYINIKNLEKYIEELE